MEDNTSSKNGRKVSKKGRMTRRTMLKTTSMLGVGLTSMASFPTVHALSSQNNTTDKAGITNGVKTLLEKGKVKQARQRLKSNSVAFDHSQSSHIVPPVNTGLTPQDSSTEDGQGVWDTINFDLIGFHLGGSRYHVFYQWTLSSDEGCVCLYYPPPTDGVGLTWVDEFEYEDGTVNPGPEITETTVQRPGILARFDDYPADEPSDYEEQGQISSDIEKQYSGQHNVYGNYTHTWSDGVQGSVGFGLNLGAVAVTYTSRTASAWEYPSIIIEI